MVDPTDPAQVIAALDASRDGAAEARREVLVALGPTFLPLARAGLARLRTWRGRRSLIYTAIKFARVSEDAVALGRAALDDKSGRVRSMGCALLAYSLRRDALGALESLRNDPDAAVAADASAAITAIRKQNHHLYQNRTASGRVFWHVLGAPDT